MRNDTLPPLIVDLDGTLVLAETSWRSARASFRRNPLAALKALWAYADGRASGKRAFAEIAVADAAALPYRTPLIAFLQKEKERGRRLHLVTAADQKVADAVASHLGLFDTAHGSNGEINLKSYAKLAFLDARFPGGFDYIGDSAADLPIWRAIGRAMLVGRALEFTQRLRDEGVHILATV
jgi:hypothetical protein